MSKNIIKLSISGFLGYLSATLGNLAMPVYILIILSLIDYVTGVIAAKCRNEMISSVIGINGIAKKISLFILIMIGGVLDWLLVYSAELVGFNFDMNFAVACFVSIWIICNEIISILENISDIGAPLPPFLLKIANLIKAKTESENEVNQEEE